MAYDHVEALVTPHQWAWALANQQHLGDLVHPARVCAPMLAMASEQVCPRVVLDGQLHHTL